MELLNDFLSWVWARHHNELSWYVRPLFLLPFCFFAYKRSLPGILVTLLIFPTSLFWFPAPENPSARVEGYLAWERQFLLEGSVVARVALVLLVVTFFVALAVAFWRRSWLWGLAVLNAGTLLKVIWSVAFGGTAGWASLAPSLFTLAVTDAALLLAMRFLRHRRGRREDATRDAERSHDVGTTTLPRRSRTQQRLSSGRRGGGEAEGGLRMNTSKVVERPRGTVDVPHCSWRPESERMKGDPNVTNLDVTPDAQETARQGTQAQELAGKARNVQRAACCIVGGGPAGAMLGLLLARKRVDVVVLEKHGDFLRDFRGDTIHPSTMEIMNELGLAEKLLRVKHTRAPRLRFRTPRGTVTVADFRRLKTRFPYVAFMPQWDFLAFVTGEAKRYPNFRLEMNAEVKELVEEDGAVQGVRYEAPDGAHELRADLTVAADGRHSRVRERSGLRVIETGPPIDVLWFRLPRREGDPEESSGYIGAGKVLVLINRGEYWQTAYVIPKGSDRQMREAGLEAFRRSIGEAVPYVADRTGELRDWEQVKLLSVQINHLKRWHRPGLSCIGDAAHAMSPVGGVGINLAIQDAVAAANALAGPLLEGSVRVRHLRSVQRRREIPTRAIQGFQTMAHRRVFAPAVNSGGLPSPPAPVRALLRLRAVRDLPSRIIAFGVWLVHVDR